MAALLMAAVLLIGACSAAAPERDGGTDTPVAPVLTSMTADATSVTVSWEAPDTSLVVSAYELRWRRDSHGSDSDSDWDSAGSAKVESTETSYKITGLSPGTDYEIQVRAVFTTDGPGDWSQSIPARTGDSTPTTPTTPVPGAPAVTAGTVTTTSVTVHWTPPQTTLEISSYQLRWRISGASGDDWTEVDNIPKTDTSHDITGLSPGTSYEIQVRAVFTDGPGDWSQSLAARTGDSTPTTPTTPVPGAPVVTAGTVTTTSVTVHWTPPQTTLEISSYQLRWRISGASGDDWTDPKDIPDTDTSHAITGLYPRTEYAIEVRAVYTSGDESRWSRTLAATKADPPTVSVAAAAATFDENENQVWFRLTLSEAVNDHLRVKVLATETGANRMRSGPMVWVSILSETIDWTFVIPLRNANDSTVEPDSVITVTIQPGPGYVVGSPSSASTIVLDND